MSEQASIRAYLCDDCWNKTPQFVVATKSKEEKVTIDSPMSDWPLVSMIIIGYYLVFHG